MEKPHLPHLLSETAAFLRVLWSGATKVNGTRFEFRALHRDGRRECGFGLLPLCEAGAAQALRWAHEMNRDGFDLYYGVQPRTRRGGKSEDVAGYIALPLDFDSAEDAQKGIGMLVGAGLPPSAIVHSGRGAHAYLLLDAPSTTDRARGIARRLCAWTGSDPVFDPARIMRLPGTRNWKPAAAGAVATMTLLRPDRAYPLEFIDSTLDLVGAPSATPVSSTTRRTSGPRATSHLPSLHETARTRELVEALSPRMRDLVLNGHRPDDGYESRSEADFAAVCALISEGASDDEIEDVLQSCGIGAKYREAGRHYFELTVDRARAAREATDLVLVKRAHRVRADRALLTLLVIGGAHAGRSFVQGVSFGDGQRARVIAHLFRSVGLSPPIASQMDRVQNLVGRTAAVRLRDMPNGIEVALWLPPGAATGIETQPPPTVPLGDCSTEDVPWLE